MLQKESKKRIMELFFDFPTSRFQLREISRKIKIAPTSVKKHLEELIKENLVLKVNGGIYPYFIANQDEEVFRFLKSLNIVERMRNGGLIFYIEEKCYPISIILFGSASRGEDIEKSDIDLFVQSKEMKLDLSKFEKILNRKINVFFERDFSRLAKELKNNILNGVKLYGYIEVFK